MAITINDAFTALSDIVKDIGDLSNEQRIRMANYAADLLYDIQINEDPEQFATVSTFSVTSATDTYALPADFRTIDIMGMGVFYIDENTNLPTPQPLPQQYANSNVTGFFIKGTNMIFTPFPTESISYSLRYIPNRTQFTALTDTFSIPDGTKDELVDIILYYYGRFDQQIGQDQFNRARMEQAIARFAEKINKGVKIGYTEDFSQYYSGYYI